MLLELVLNLGADFNCPTKQKLKIIQCITNRAIKICTVDCLDEELESVKIFNH